MPTALGRSAAPIAIPRGRDAVEQIVDQRLDEYLVDRFVGDQEPVIDRAPQLINYHLDVRPSPNLPILLSLLQSYGSKPPALAGVELPIRRCEFGIGL